MTDAVHRILTGQVLTDGQLRAAGYLVLTWFVMDLIQWIDWLMSKFH